MNIEYLILGLTSAGLLCYLLYSLLQPEKL